MHKGRDLAVPASRWVGTLEGRAAGSQGNVLSQFSKKHRVETGFAQG